MNNPSNALAADQYWRLKWLLRIIAGLLGEAVSIRKERIKTPKRKGRKRAEVVPIHSYSSCGMM
jgi:hypothetical protein